MGRRLKRPITCYSFSNAIIQHNTQLVDYVEIIAEDLELEVHSYN